jgi:hypothetical protein
MKIEEFLENNRVFTLSQWKQNGFSKKDIKRDDVVFYSTFLVSVKQNNGKVVDRYEKIYLHSRELAELYKKIKRTERHNSDYSEVATSIKDMVADIFSTLKEEGDSTNE